MEKVSSENKDIAESTSKFNVNLDVDLSKAVGNLVSPVIKILDMFGSACGVIGSPLRKMLDGKADAYVMDENASVMEKHKGLPIEYSNDNVCISTKQLDNFHKRMIQREWNHAEKREENIEKIVIKATEKVANEPKVNMLLPDQDWLLRFFTSAQDISTEEMQDIWAGILAETAKNSKSYSLRTLTTLHSMSKYDAELFIKVCSYAMKINNYTLIPRYDESMKDDFISYDEILHLAECGLLNSSGTVTYNLELLKKGETPFSLNDEFILFISSKNEREKFIIPQYPLTIPGKELLTLFKQQPTLEESKKFAMFIMQENKNKLEHFSMNRVIEKMDDGQVKYDSSPLVKL